MSLSRITIANKKRPKITFEKEPVEEKYPMEYPIQSPINDLTDDEDDKKEEPEEEVEEDITDEEREEEDEAEYPEEENETDEEELDEIDEDKEPEILEVLDDDEGRNENIRYNEPKASHSEKEELYYKQPKDGFLEFLRNKGEGISPKNLSNDKINELRIKYREEKFSHQRAETIHLKNPLFSNTRRRKQRRLALSGENAPQKSVPELLPEHIKKCIRIHKTKPWIKNYYMTVIAPLHGTDEHPEYFDEFFREEFGRKWYKPSNKYWMEHCKILHNPDDRNKCHLQNHIQTLSVKHKNIQFYYAIVLFDGSMKMANDDMFKDECEWWKTQRSSDKGKFEVLLNSKLNNLSNNNKDKLRSFTRQEILIALLSIDISSFETQEKLLEDIASRKYENSQFIEYSKGIEEVLYEKIRDEDVYAYFLCLESVLVFLQPEFKSKMFKQNMKSMLYKPSELFGLTFKDKYPEVYIQNQDNIYNTFFNSYVMNASYNVAIEFYNSISGGKALPKTHQKSIPYSIENPKNICGGDRLFIYKEDTEYYCLDLDEILMDEPINPYTLEELDQSFVSKIKKQMNNASGGNSYNFEPETCNTCSNTSAFKTNKVSLKHGQISIKKASYCSPNCLEKEKDY